MYATTTVPDLEPAKSNSLFSEQCFGASHRGVVVIGFKDFDAFDGGVKVEKEEVIASHGNLLAIACRRERAVTPRGCLEWS
jgi:hypothetical protein